MWVLVFVTVVIFLVLASLVVALAMRKTQPELPPPRVSPPEDSVARRERQHAVDLRGSELIERRVELDTRRGTLGGDSNLERALDQLYQRLENGQISEQEFEQEKIRLLSE